MKERVLKNSKRISKRTISPLESKYTSFGNPQKAKFGKTDNILKDIQSKPQVDTRKVVQPTIGQKSAVTQKSTNGYQDIPVDQKKHTMEERAKYGRHNKIDEKVFCDTTLTDYNYSVMTKMGNQSMILKDSSIFKL
jgi:hypothetical protein